jgi:sugar lactone lactonase YvrE
MWVAQDARNDGPRLLLRVDAAGLAEAVALPAGLKPADEVLDLAAGPGGLLYALIGVRKLAGGATVHRRLPGGSWEAMLPDLHVDRGRLAVDAAGTVYMGEDARGRLLRLVPGTPVEVLAGPGLTVGTPPLVAPGGVLPAPDGTLYVSDLATNVVHARSPQGAWRAVAGNVETRQTDASQLVFNTPAGIAFDAEGRLVVSEAGGNAVKRWDGRSLETIAGGAEGEAVEDVPALEARFAVLGGIAYRGAELIVADIHNNRLRAVGADGRVRSLTAQANPPVRREGLAAGEAVPAAQFRVRPNGGVAVGPDGSVYFACSLLGQVLRLGPDGLVRAVAGKPMPAGQRAGDGPDGPALEAGLIAPLGLAFRPGEPDNLYVADFGNARVRRIVGVSGAAPRVETVAGAGRVPSLLKLGLEPGWEAAENGLPAMEAALLLPLGLAFDAAGRLYVGESGTLNLKQLAANEDDFEALKVGGELPPLGARVRRLEPDGRLTTLMGPGGRLAPDPAAPDGLGAPMSLGFDRQGRLAIVDARTNSVRLVPAKALE